MNFEVQATFYDSKNSFCKQYMCDSETFNLVAFFIWDIKYEEPTKSAQQFGNKGETALRDAWKLAL